ncbi:hypothetical protein [Hyella patelloides]
MSFIAKVDNNGKLNIQLPPELANQELDLVIVYQSTQQTKSEDIHDVVDSFYGCLEDDPILVEEQNQKETA